MDLIEETFLSQSIGISGYIYCINSKGIITIHPNEKLRGRDVSNFEFVKQQMEIKDGYIEYNWKNPGESEERPKALYMTYYKPLDMIISASSYREEFTNLVNTDDFRASVLSYRFGKTGYAFVMGEKGRALIHPSLQGVNISQDPRYPSNPVKKILALKNGKLTYPWKNPGETEFRNKLVLFSYLPEFNWYVAASCYIDEIFAPLQIIRNILIAALFAVIILAVVLTYLIGSSIIKPLDIFMEKLKQGAQGNFSIRMNYRGTDEMGQLSGYFDYFMDRLEDYHNKINDEINHHLETRRALEKSELQLRGFFNQSFQFSALLTPDGMIENVNQTALDFAGCRAHEVHGRPYWETPWWSHDTLIALRIKDAVSRAGAGDLIRFETTNISRDKEIRNIDFSIKPVLDEEGKVAFLIPEGRDITDLKQAGEENKLLESKLHQAQKMEAIGTLAGGIAHDFNNILSGIFGFAQLAQYHIAEPEKAEKDIDQIIKGAQKAADLIQQILTFSHQANPEKHPLQIAIVIKEALKLMRATIPTTIEIKNNIATQALVLADPTKIHQVAINLVTNAFHAMQKTGGILKVSLTDISFPTKKQSPHPELLPGNYVDLEVSDTGYGMGKKTISKIFDPYFTTKKTGKGTGLGLAVVHGIVDEHGGQISVSSSPGKGTTFHVYFPVAPGTNRDIRPSHAKKTCPVSGRERVLFADDEESIRSVVHECLTHLGFKVTTFKNGAEAFKAFEENPDAFDIVITDMAMPKMTGMELASKIMDRNPAMPVILCTGYSETISKNKAMEMGIRQFLPKPIPMEKMASTIRQVLDEAKN